MFIHGVNRRTKMSDGDELKNRAHCALLAYSNNDLPKALEEVATRCIEDRDPDTVLPPFRISMVADENTFKVEVVAIDVPRTRMEKEATTMHHNPETHFVCLIEDGIFEIITLFPLKSPLL